MALTTTTTSVPCRRVRATWSATARIRSASPTEVPPNFWTTSGIRTRLQTCARRPAPGRPGPSRPRAVRPGWATRGTPGMGRVSGRAQREASPPARRREARLAAEAKGRSAGGRSATSSSWSSVAGVIVGIVFLVSGGNNKPARDSPPPPRPRRVDQGHRRQAAGPGQQGGGQGRLPGQHQDHGQHPEVLGGAADDDRHVARPTRPPSTRRPAPSSSRSTPRPPRHRQQLRLPGAARLLQLRDLPPGHPGLHGPDRRSRPAPARADPATPIADENPPKAASATTSTRSARWPWPTPAAAHQRQPVLHRGRPRRARACPNTYSLFGQVTRA